VGVRQRLAVEHAERPHRIRPPLRHGFDRIVDGGIDMLTHELHRDLAAAAEGDIGELGAGGLLDRNRDDLVLLLGAGAALPGSFLAASIYSLGVLYGVSAFTHRMNSSSA